jgi:hypothetical protein
LGSFVDATANAAAFGADGRAGTALFESAGEEERLSRRTATDIVDFVSRRQSLESL